MPAPKPGLPCLQPPVDLPASKVGPTPHTGSPASIQAARAPSCATGWACHHIHTHVWPWETTHLFHSLSMSGNDSARSKERATTTGDTQEAPELARHHISHTCHSTAFHVLSTRIAEPLAGWEAPPCSCKATLLLLCTRCTNRYSCACAHGMHLRAPELFSTMGFS